MKTAIKRTLTAMKTLVGFSAIKKCQLGNSKMKKLILSVLLVMSANSYAFPINANVQLNNQTGYAEVVNHWNRPIVCSGYLKGLDVYGNWNKQWINNMVIFPGGYHVMEVGVFGHNYLVDAGANINCNF